MGDISIPMGWKPGDAVTIDGCRGIGIIIELLFKDEGKECVVVYWPHDGIDICNSTLLQLAFC